MSVMSVRSMHHGNLSKGVKTNYFTHREWQLLKPLILLLCLLGYIEFNVILFGVLIQPVSPLLRKARIRQYCDPSIYIDIFECDPIAS